MWLLNAEQARRLVALQRERDLLRIGGLLAEVFPEACGRLAERWPAFIALGAERASAQGLTHMLCIARLLCAWVACGAEFESRDEWAAALLTDPRRNQSAKAFQLCVRVLEQLRVAHRSGQPTASEFTLALQRLDTELAASGELASLLARERIRLGSPCDVDAIDLRLVDVDWRQHYTARGGPWRREPCGPHEAHITLVNSAGAEAALELPAQITLLSRPPYGDAAAKLRVRTKAQHRCDALVHPLLQCQGPGGARVLRGALAADATFSVHAEGPPADAAVEVSPPPCMGQEDSPQLSVLTLGSCGLRERGMPTGELSTLLAAYDATQHLVAWRHEPLPAWTLPAEALPPIAPARCRREADGVELDASAWQAGFLALDQQLQQGISRLFTGWERDSGVTDGRLSVEAALLAGSAGVTWGWAERPQGIGVPPYMRLEGLLDLVACQLALRFSGTLSKAGSRSQLVLSTQGQAGLRGDWQRSSEDAALFMVAARQQAHVRQTFTLDVLPLADAGLASLSACGPVRGCIAGAVGLEQRPDGPGLRWFVRLAVEAVSVRVRVADPLLGTQFMDQPLLPPHKLVDWSLA